MVDLVSPPTPATNPAPRHERRRRRRRTRLAVALVAIGVAAAVVAALFVTGTLGTESNAAPRAERVVTDLDPEPEPPAPEPVPRRPLTPEDPLRLWIAGDSLAGALGPALGEVTAQTGVVQPQYDSRVSSGLLNDDFFDWPEHTTEQLAELDPEAIVFVVGTNDANAWSDNQAAEYAQLTESFMRQLAAHDRDVYWVNAPVMRDDDLEDNVQVVNEIQRQAAARVPGVTYIDAHARFADSAGEYQSSITDASGDRVSLRAGDGIHFSPDGAEHLAETVYAALDETWHITEQRVEGQPKQVRVTKGSTHLGGSPRQYRSSSNSSGSSSGRSYSTPSTTRAVTSTPSSTSPPATSPPTTSPPATTPPTTSPPATTPTTAASPGG